ncbi:hypothetical protein LC607_17080 [Nostoc sp. CHAB 5824]|nr:hypothetical protein [Nostoc sp. CHAB 5824]
MQERSLNWINQTNNGFDNLLPLVDKDVKAGKAQKAIFKLFSSGELVHQNPFNA